MYPSRPSVMNRKCIAGYPRDGFFQAIVIKDEFFDNIFLEPLGAPDRESRGNQAFHPLAHRDDHVLIVVVQRTLYFAISLGSNCQVFLDSCLRHEFAFLVNVFNVRAYVTGSSPVFFRKLPRLFPRVELRDLQNDLHGLLHGLDGDELVFAVGVVTAGEDIRRNQPPE